MTDEEMENSLERHKLWQSGFDAGFKAGYESARDWTPCSEGLPEQNEDGTYNTVRATYIELDGSRCVTDAVFMSEFDEWFDASDEKQRDLENVLAWKPQDAPWSGEVKEG